VNFFIPLIAGIGSAISYGISSVLQKVSVDKEVNVATLKVSLFLRLLKDSPYLLGIVLDLGGWVLNLVSVHSLPLFLVQALIASSVVVAALIERIYFHRFLSSRVYIAITAVLVGLILIGVGASPEKTFQPILSVRVVIIIVPILIAILGGIFVRSRKPNSYLSLALLSGLSFGGTSIIGRVITYNHPFMYYVTNPLIWALLAYGVIGIVLFTIALQRSVATKVLAAVIASETLIPILVGSILFNDRAKAGLWIEVWIGVGLVIAGSIVTTLNNNLEIKSAKVSNK
jgi:drug/metabolite transporter (DMT)-like permease